MTSKRCKDCGRRRRVKFFYACAHAKDGLTGCCKDCKQARRRKAYKARKEEGYKAQSPVIRKRCIACGRHRLAKFFYTHLFTKDGLTGCCKDCERVRARKAYEANKERYKAQSAQWRADNLEASRKHKRKSSREQRRKNGKQINARHAAYKKAHPELFTEHENRRRARKFAAAIEKIDRREIYERDGGHCHICSGSVSFREMELDHVIPLARGGSHTRGNLKVAHKICNRRKWANVA